MHFYQDKLNYYADIDSGMKFLQKTHERYLPKEFKKKVEAKA